MNARGVINKRSIAVVLATVVMSLFVWAAPAGAIKIERGDSASAQKDRKTPPPTKESGNKARTHTRSLLDDVESQKKTETARDSLDTWIDRDGDGVNDNMKKQSTTGGQRVKERQPEPVQTARPKPVQTAQPKPVQTAQPKTEPQEQKQDREPPKKTTTKKRRR